MAYPRVGAVVWEGVLLLWALLVVLAAAGARGIVVHGPPTHSPSSSLSGSVSLLPRDHGLLIVVYLNATAFPSSGESTTAFLLALKDDLHDGVLPGLSRVEGDSSSVPPSGEVPECSLHCSTPHHAGTVDNANVTKPCASHPILLCMRKIESQTIPVQLYTECRERIHSLYRLDRVKHSEFRNGQKNVFARSSEAYHEMTGDPRHIVAVGGDCRLLRPALGSPETKSCGRISCVGVAMTVVAAVILLIVVAFLVLYFWQRLGCCLFADDDESSPSSQLIIHTSHNAEKGRSLASKTSTNPLDPPGLSHRLFHYRSENVGASLSTPSALDEAKFLEIEAYLSQEDSKPSTTASTASLHRSIPSSSSYEPPQLTDVDPPLDNSKRNSSSGAAQSERASPHIRDVDISKEEREQLQRQRSWLMEHVMGLDTL
ncbi:hypothetical protein DQ04_03391020 [Trypanosoma grayi]|uniref:hypothetical protein n=1 Tax=Trypanosoma grayi TaxID=71804 RepID=UPI0004F42DC0|nr:hypothetical protein DQ04_03391020 [Trypanosoma grayi]KEG10704.1 hypothetical protein DQ04_03391020 [Trypanosoma grayi]